MKSNFLTGFQQIHHPQAEQEKEHKMLKKEKSAIGITDFVFEQLNNNSDTVPVQHQKPVQLNFMQLLLQNSTGDKHGKKV